MRLLIDGCLRRRTQFRDAFGYNHTATPHYPQGWFDALLMRHGDDYDEIYLDGDLGCEPFSGEDIARMMAGLKLHLKAKVYIHSANVLRSRAMYETLKGTHDVREVCWDDVVNPYAKGTNDVSP
jgi:hypothetical protein